MGATEFPRSFARGKARPLMVMEMADGGLRASDSAGELQQCLRRWVGQAQWQLLSSNKGRVVKQVDNGLMMEFADARGCLEAAFALNRLTDAAGLGAGSSKRLRLRAGAHLAHYSQSHDEVVDRDVRLTSGLTALAKPGEVLLTAELRDRLADGLDGDFDDLGYRRVQPLTQPLRLFRAHPVQGDASDWAMVVKHDLRPGLAVMPFRTDIPQAKHWMLGELIADGVIARLSHSIGFRVISRQSTSALRNRGGMDEIERHLGATFILSGSYTICGKKLVVSAALAEMRSQALLWSGQLRQSVDDLLQEESELLHKLAGTVAQALGTAQVRKALVQPLPRLDSSFLLLAGISMTHSHSAKTFKRGREALTALTVRHPKLALPRAWLGIWHVLNVLKSQSNDIGRDTSQAHEQTLRALEAEPDNAMALAVEGYIQCLLLDRPQQARQSLDAAIEANPSEPMAWLFRSLFSFMWGSSAASVTEAYIARSLSPVDPLRYFFDVFTSNALLADRKQEQAIASAQRSLRADKHHPPTLRLLLTAQAELGRIEEAKETLGRLLAEVPQQTVSSYLAMGGSDSPLRQRIGTAMQQLGVPDA